MKANELMVGDFVMMGKKNYRCANICGHTNDVLLDNGVITNVGNLSPIPLTPEILEKNGFKYNPFGTGFYECKTEDGNIACTISNNCWSFYINDNIIPNHFYYVHELQHALKLCGIEIEINF